jgi:hypothetical protein
MKRSVLLTILSLTAILLTTFHISDDIVRGFEPGGFKNLIGIAMFGLWLYGALVLAGRRSGYVIMLLGSLLGSVMPVAHMMGAGMVGGRVEGSSGIHFWVWTMLTLGVVSLTAAILAARSIWNPEWASGPAIATGNAEGKTETETG